MVRADRFNPLLIGALSPTLRLVSPEERSTWNCSLPHVGSQACKTENPQVGNRPWKALNPIHCNITRLPPGPPVSTPENSKRTRPLKTRGLDDIPRLIRDNLGLPEHPF